MSDVERAVVGAREDAGGQWLILIDFWQDAAGAACRVEDLYTEFACYIKAADLINRHAVTF